MKKLLIIFSTLAALIAISACSNGEPAEIVPQKLELTITESRAAQDVNGFGIEFFREISLVKPTNVLVSPLSAAAATSMLANGLDDGCAAQITGTLGCESLDALNSLNSKMLKVLPYVDPAVTIGLANGAWYQKGYTLRPEFQNTLTDTYATDIFAANIPTEETRTDINRWVNAKTKGLITNFLEQKLDVFNNLFLVNALYLSAPWSKPFKESNTTTEVFHGLYHESKVEMMHREGDDLIYIDEFEKFSAVRRSFGNGKFHITMILPAEDVDIKSFIKDCDFTSVLSGKYSEALLNLSFPKFKIEPEEMKITEVLQSLGMEFLADPVDTRFFTEAATATFNIMQKATIEFSEKEVKAAAATGVAMQGANRAPIPITVTFDRPFVFFINEATSGTCLFAGKVVDL